MRLLAICLLITPLFAADAPWPFDAKEAAKRQSSAAKSLKLPKELTLDLGNNTPIQFVLIPAGTFKMGSPESEVSQWPTPGARRTNEVLHDVTISRAFYMSVYKVTQEQYTQIVGSNPSVFPGKNHPVDAVTWDDANHFCELASTKTKRKIHLPTEAQWEYAARAGTATRYFFADDEAKIADFMWYRENSGGKTHPVGLKPANAWGLFDVHGLLWEHVADFFADAFTAEKTDPTGPPTGDKHTVRAGTYGSRPPFVRTAVRTNGPANNATKDNLGHYGFRVALALDK